MGGRRHTGKRGSVTQELDYAMSRRALHHGSHALLLIIGYIHVLAICVVVHVTDGLQIEFDCVTRAAERPLSTGGVAMQHIHIPKASGTTIQRLYKQLALIGDAQLNISVYIQTLLIYKFYMLTSLLNIRPLA